MISEGKEMGMGIQPAIILHFRNFLDFTGEKTNNH